MSQHPRFLCLRPTLILYSFRVSPKLAERDGAEPTKEHREEIQGVIVLLDRLTKLMQKHGVGSYPTGSLGPIADARGTLNMISLDHSEFAGAKEALKAVLRDWDDFWRDEELEG